VSISTSTPTLGAQHVAIIMDGNGRWAQKRFRPRFWGHVRGASILSSLVFTAKNLGLKSLSVFAFSTENWSRPSQEITFLFKLLEKFLEKERNSLIQGHVFFKVVGDISPLPLKIQEKILRLERDTQDFASYFKFFVCFGYSGRQEILQICQNIAEEARPNPEKQGKQITDEDIIKYLQLPIPDIDILIRTGGEFRISNFTLWQMAYAELVFTPTLWPDFTPQEFTHIVESVAKRQRRFGGIPKDAKTDLTLNQTSQEAFVQKQSLAKQLQDFF